MKSTEKHVYGLIFTLAILGFAMFLYRHFVLDVPLTDTETVNSWTVEANIHFTAKTHQPAKVSFNIPYMPPNYAILDEYFIAHNYGVTSNLVGLNRQTVWSLRRPTGKQSLYYRAIFRETAHAEVNLPKPRSFTPIETIPENERTAIKVIANNVRQTSADIETFAQSAIRELNKKEGNAKLLVGNDFSDEKIIEAAIKVLNEVKISALMVKGIRLSQQSKADFIYYMAVFNDQKWIFIHPVSGTAGLPKDVLIWQYGNTPTLTVQGGKTPQFTLTVSPTPINALTIAKSRGVQADSELLRFSLLQLPITTQETYKILLMVPIGAFIILLLRNFIGIKTFGTFMPVLIALAFRETNVVWGVILFSFIVSLGLIARFYLDQLRLLLVPRLAAILTVVVFLMIFISIFSHSLGLDIGLSVALFPMVILTMTIERMCITWDERGAKEAFQSGIGSLFAAVIAFWAMNIPNIQYLMFAFPELLLILLALILLFGQYRGYRLLELKRFKALAGD